MKKTIVLALALILTLSLAVPAAAADIGSPVAPETSTTVTAPLPEIVEKEIKLENGATVTIEPVAADKAEEMNEEEQKTFVAAQEKLEEAAPQGMKTQFFFYAKVTKTDVDGTSSKVTGSAAADGTVKTTTPVNMTIKLDSILELANGAGKANPGKGNANGKGSANGNVNGNGNANGNLNGKGYGVGNGEAINKIVVMQFIDGKWIELKTVINDDGTITIEGVVDGPMAIFTK